MLQDVHRYVKREFKSLDTRFVPDQIRVMCRHVAYRKQFYGVKMSIWEQTVDTGSVQSALDNLFSSFIMFHFLMKEGGGINPGPVKNSCCQSTPVI